MKKNFLQLKNKDNTCLIIVFSLATLLLMMLPLISRELVVGHDWTYHLLRIEALKTQLAQGQFPVRLSTMFFGGYGYPTSIFYADTFLYIPAILRLLGFSIENSAKFFIILCLWASYALTYYCVKRISHSSTTALIAAMIYGLAQYHLQTMYTRFALGEVQAFVFFPIIIYALYDYLYEDFKRPWLFILGFWGLLNCHLISTLIALLVCIVVCVFCFKRTFQTKKLIKLGLTAAATAGFTCNIWLPLAEQMLGQTFYSNVRYSVEGCAVAPLTLLGYQFKVSDNYFEPGLAVMVLLLGHLFVSKERRKTDAYKLSLGCLGFGLFFLWMATNLFPWTWMPEVIQKIQFPWRFYGVATLFLAISIAFVMTLIFQEKYSLIGIALTFMVLALNSSGLYQTLQTKNIGPDFYSEAANTYPDCGYEYLIADIPKDRLLSADHNVYTDTGALLDYSQQKGVMTVRIDNTFAYVDVPLLYYKGYSARFINTSGEAQALEITGENTHPAIRIFTENIKESGYIEITYRGTMIQKATFGLYCTLILLSLLRGMIWLFKTKTHNRRGN